jgi:hypothetical protein
MAFRPADQRFLVHFIADWLILGSEQADSSYGLGLAPLPATCPGIWRCDEFLMIKILKMTGSCMTRPGEVLDDTPE